MANEIQCERVCVFVCVCLKHMFAPVSLEALKFPEWVITILLGESEVETVE